MNFEFSRPVFILQKLIFVQFSIRKKNKREKRETVHVNNSKAAKMETDRLADIEHKIEPQSPKLVQKDRKWTRDRFRGLEDPEKPRFEGSNFGLDRRFSALAPNCEEMLIYYYFFNWFLTFFHGFMYWSCEEKFGAGNLLFTVKKSLNFLTSSST